MFVIKMHHNSKLKQILPTELCLILTMSHHMYDLFTI